MIDPPLHQLIYVSRFIKSIAPTELRRLVKQSEERNFDVGVTGVLLVHGQSAMQLVEGDRRTVLALYEKISRDPRHTDVQVMLSKAVARRLYPEWGMGLNDLRSRLELDRVRMSRMISDIRSFGDTKAYSLEARVLLRDFESQAELAA